MYPDLKEKIIVVTGGTKGIGFEIAQAFLENGAKVAICSSNEENVKQAKSKFRGLGFNVFGMKVDVSSKNSLFEFADRVEEVHGKIDVWVSNAGIYPQYKIIDTPENVWDKVMNVNLKSVYISGLIAKEKMRQGGVLINAVSFAAIIPSKGSGAYAASKAGVYSLTKSLAAELADYGIRVNGFIPGVIKTEMTEEVLENNREQVVNQIVLKKPGTGRDVANAVLFLGSEQSQYITGTFIEISGGKFSVQNI